MLTCNTHQCPCSWKKAVSGHYDRLFLFGYVLRKDVVGLLLIGLFSLLPACCEIACFSHSWAQCHFLSDIVCTLSFCFYWSIYITCVLFILRLVWCGAILGFYFCIWVIAVLYMLCSRACKNVAITSDTSNVVGICLKAEQESSVIYELFINFGMYVNYQANLWQKLWSFWYYEAWLKLHIAYVCVL